MNNPDADQKQRCGVLTKTKTKTPQVTGLKKLAGVMFFAENGKWVANIGPVKLTLNHYSYKCTATDTRDGYFRGFHTITAARLFAKRRRHGRTIVEHMRAEKLKAEKERLGLSRRGLAKLIGVSEKTIENYFSGYRAVPEGVGLP